MSRRWLTFITGLVAATLMAVLIVLPSARSSTLAAGGSFNVNSSADVVDADPGDGVCSTSVPDNGVCTLRAAVQETNALSGPDTIILEGTTYTYSQYEITITDALTISGVAGQTVIDANGSVTGARVFFINPIPVTLSGLTMTGGKASYGGGIYSAGGNLFLDRVTMSNNVATGQQIGSGGAIYSEGGSIRVTNSILSNNSSSYQFGGGIFMAEPNPTLIVTSSYIDGNSAVDGAGIYMPDASEFTITDSTINANNATGSGGGIYTAAALTMRNSTISYNTANEGAGIYVNDLVRVINSTISSNCSNGSGGGVYLETASSSATFSNATVAGNCANVDERGVAFGGGIMADHGSVFLANTIVAGNKEYFVTANPKPQTRSSNCYGTMLASYSIVPDSYQAECEINGSSTSNADPQLAGLQDNGGPTNTHALQQGSPAIDGGNPIGCYDKSGNPLPADQRGALRVGACDIGAFEYNGVPPATPSPTPSPTPTPSATPTSSPSPTATPTSTIPASHTPTPSPTPTHAGSGEILGDADCDEDVDMHDAVADLSEIAEVAPGACDDRADADCDTDIDAMDALRIAAHVSTAPMTQPDGCRHVGTAGY